MAIGWAVRHDCSPPYPRALTGTATAAVTSASPQWWLLGNRSRGARWSFQEPSRLTALSFMAPPLLMIHTLSYSASTATRTDRFRGSCACVGVHALAHTLAHTHRYAQQQIYRFVERKSTINKVKFHLQRNTVQEFTQKHTFISCTLNVLCNILDKFRYCNYDV